MEDFIERMGLIAEGDGLPRIAGRIMGLMVIDGGPISFAQLAKQLDVSRGSVSTNTRFLESLGVLERVARRGERQDFFQLANTPYVRLLQGSAERMTKALSVVQKAQADLPPSNVEAYERLEELRAFYKALNESFLDIAERFSNTKSDKQ